ncbi:hypothetical protein A3A21_02590 [Candidatus Jorgensenbacteria bacterium RIFCSPLOWO2_01_FULL_45_25b]|uniref:tRNA-dihydrouridine synthase n=1 Tax=Candidatus Jorgensenbacteria bacterium RIFCSPLOWO2_01_FULL_45_25b TaxID=1798471 RepID=A0A1F6BZS8_9BACT|nr:MAG: hypothetical protein A3A21_02590 [Candidatus Jorgensenbacteria bacterium RIFCSPLOWO2_01_FULL_45_25b]
MRDMNFWEHIKKPVMALAPMANVTDAAFRKMIAKYGKPDVMWTEFVSCDGLCSKGMERLLPDLWYGEEERPIIAQIFGSKPEHVYKTAELLKNLGFDGIDINMGCPDRSVEKQGAGATLIKNQNKAGELIKAAKEGGGGLPVSVKTRIGYAKDITEEWIESLLEHEPAVITIHARTRKEMSDVPANWDAIRRAVNVRNEKKSKTLIIGNGDVVSLDEAREKAEQTKCDGVMIGKGIFGNPWLFGERSLKEVSVPERLRVMCEHASLFEEMFKNIKNFSMMKKHFKSYVNEFEGAKELRMELMETKQSGEVGEIVERFLSTKR